MIPVKYNVRSLRARWVASLLTVLGTALVVWASVLAFGLGAGLDHTLEVSSDPLDLIALRKGATSETSSGIEDERVRQIITLPGIATDPQGRPFASPELVIVVNTVRRNEGGRTNLILRGVTPIARQLRPGFRLVEGRDLKPGLREAITSRSVAERFENAGLGQQFKALGTTFRIVGLFEAGDSAIESEIWTDVKILGQAAKREGAVSSVQLRSASLDHMKNLQKRLSDDQRFGLKAVTEAQYYADQAESGTAIKIVGQIISTFLTFGALFAVANTMFGAVAARSREIGTLRALGFGRASIMGGFLLESLLLCLAGGALGSLATLPINGLSTGTANWVTFSELTFSFRFGPDVLAYGVVLASFMGLLGGLLPAIRATRMKIVDALREI